jgi:hypothetical protein
MVLKDIAFVIALVIAVKNIEGMQYTEFNYAYATKITGKKTKNTTPSEQFQTLMENSLKQKQN